MSAANSPHLHTWQLSRRGPVLRYYRWLYRTDLNDALSFCRLFWAIVLSPVAIIAWGFAFIGIGIAWVTKGLWHAAHRRQRPPKAEDWQPWARRVVESPRMQSAGRIFTVVWCSIMAINALAPLGLLAYKCCQYPGNFFRVLRWVLGITGIVTWIALPSWLLVRIGLVASVADWLFTHTLAPVGRGVRCVWRFAMTGYHATKYRACPRVEVLP